MLVNDCKIEVSYYLWESPRRYHVFCYHRRRDDFDVIGDFETAAEAEKLRAVMIAEGGNVSKYDNYVIK